MSQRFQQLTCLCFGFPEPPEFVLKLPATKCVKRGESLHLECKVSGTAPLKVTWYKQDTKVTDGGNYRTSFVDSVSVLELLSSSFDDDGVYTCEAQNDAGSCSCSTALTIKGQFLLTSSPPFIVHDLAQCVSLKLVSITFLSLDLLLGWWNLYSCCPYLSCFATFYWQCR